MANKEKEKKKRKLASAKKGNDAMSGFRPPYLNIPSGVEMFKFDKDRDYNIDIIPYEVGEGNPWADAGELYFCRPVYIYKDIGTDEKSRCSPKTFGKSDPVAKEIVKMVRKGTIKDGSDEHKAMQDKMRVLYWIYDRDEPEKGVRLFDSAYFKSFGVLLKNAMDKDPDDDKGYQTFHDPDGGFSLMVTVSPDVFNGKEFIKPVKVSFIKRPEGIPEEILEQAKCLDDMPIEIEGEELLKIFLGETEPEAPAGEEADDDGDDTDDEDTPPPAPPKKPAAKAPAEKPPAPTKPADDEGDETAEDLGIVKGAKVKHKALGECTVVKVSPDGTSLTLKDSDGDVHTAIAPSKVTLVKEEAKPAKADKGGKKPAPPPEDEDDIDNDSDSDEDSEDEESSSDNDDAWEDD